MSDGRDRAQQARRGQAKSVARRAESSDTRAQLIRTALKVVAKNGYAGTSIAMICREAGINASSIYWFFENKEDLFLCAIEQGAAAFLDAVALPVAADDDAGDDAVIRNVAARLEQNADFLRLLLIVMLEDQHLSPALRAKIAEIRGGSLTWWNGFLRRVFQPLGETTAGVFAADFAPLCRAAINGAFIARQYGEPIDIEHTLRQLHRLLLALVEKVQAEA